MNNIINSTKIKGARIVLLISLLFLSLSTAFSQATESTAIPDPDKDVWKNNWYLSLNGGTQLLFSNDVSGLTFEQRFTPYIALSGGKWFSPFLSLRLQVSGYALNGNVDPATESHFWEVPDPVTKEVTIRPDGSYRRYSRHINAHIDVRTSLSNLFGGIKKRSWDIVPSVGIGYFRTFPYKGTPATDNISNHFAIEGKYSITKSLDINIELSATAISSSFDGYITRKHNALIAAAAVGITCNFGGKHYTKSATVCRYEPLPTVAGNNSDLSGTAVALMTDKMDGIDKRLDNIESHLEKSVQTEKEVEKEKKTVEKTRILATIRFDLGEYASPIEDQDDQYLTIRNFMEQNPDVRLRIDGYADKGTGGKEKNFRIAGRRAESVRWILYEQLGVSFDRIDIKPVGVEEQPFEHNEENRAVIVNVYE
jgi:outer membrane protein OmpA-like peptidoglycan-associated protein